MRLFCKVIVGVFVIAWTLYACIYLTLPRKRNIIQVSTGWTKSVHVMKVDEPQRPADESSLHKVPLPPLQPSPVKKTVPMPKPQPNPIKTTLHKVPVPPLQPILMKKPALTSAERPAPPVQRPSLPDLRKSLNLQSGNPDTVSVNKQSFQDPSEASSLHVAKQDLMAAAKSISTIIQRSENVSPFDAILQSNSLIKTGDQIETPKLFIQNTPNTIAVPALNTANLLPEVTDSQSPDGAILQKAGSQLQELDGPQAALVLSRLQQRPATTNVPQKLQTHEMVNPANPPHPVFSDSNSAKASPLQPVQNVVDSSLNSVVLNQLLNDTMDTIVLDHVNRSAAVGARTSDRIEIDNPNPYQDISSQNQSTIIQESNSSLQNAGTFLSEIGQIFNNLLASNTQIPVPNPNENANLQSFNNEYNLYRNPEESVGGNIVTMNTGVAAVAGQDASDSILGHQTGTQVIDTEGTVMKGTEETLPLASVFSDIQQGQLTSYFRSKGMNAMDGLGIRQIMQLTEVERHYLSTSPLQNILLSPDEARSKVYFMSPRTTYQAGDRVLIRVDLHDQLGRVRTSGDDEIRIWLNGSSHSVPATVTDLGNGSYTGEATLRWPGVTEVQVSLTYPRELLRLVIELRHALLSTRWIIAQFTNQERNVMEITPCLPSAPIPGYAGTCNFTVQNGYMPWFCGHPTNPSITCDHPHTIGNLPYIKPLPLSLPVQQMLYKMDSSKHLFRLIPNSITIMTEPGPFPEPLPPCWTQSPRQTWELPAHNGWLEAGMWHLDNCALPPSFNQQLVHSCMRNTTLVLLGDSNMRMMYKTLMETLGFNASRIEWHSPLHKQIPWLNSSLMFAPHAHPFNTGQYQSPLKTVSVEQLLPRLPPNYHYIIVLHYWLHLGFYPLSVFRDRIRRVKDAVERFLQVQPSAKVFLRGPHVVYNGQKHHAQFGDKFGPWYIQILKEEFKDLYDKVWFLDFWPLTIATVNYSLHPPGSTVAQMIRVLFGYACPSQ